MSFDTTTTTGASGTAPVVEAVTRYVARRLIDAVAQLDKFAVIRLARGKTNRQYLRESGKAPPQRQLLEVTMHTFEDVFFGRRVLDRRGFEACWQHVSQFENLAIPVAS